MVENDQTPMDKEWDAFLELLALNRAELQHLRLIVVTTGGGPNAEQRKRLQRTLSGAAMRVAVVSDSMKVRFIASAIMLFHRDHRSFTTSEVHLAYSHLGLTFSEQRDVESAITELTPMVQ